MQALISRNYAQGNWIDKILDNDWICSRHFISESLKGKAIAALEDNNPDCLPTLSLSHFPRIQFELERKVGSGGRQGKLYMM